MKVQMVCAALLFVVVIACGIRLGTYHALVGRGEAPLPIASLNPAPRPVMHLELVRNERDIRQILMTGDSTRNLADVKAGTWLDTWLFIPAYSGLLATLILLLVPASGPGSRRLRPIGLALVCGIAALDLMENYGIVRAVAHLESSAPIAPDAFFIWVPSLGKWILLGVTLTGLGIVAVQQAGLWRRVTGLLAFAAGAPILGQMLAYCAERLGSSS